MLLMISFGNPWMLLLLLLIPLLAVIYIMWNRRMHTSLGLAPAGDLSGLPKTLRTRLIHMPFILRILLIAGLCLLIARPQSHYKKSDVRVEGIDIMMALDISGSMLARDFKPDRLEASKEVALDFIGDRPDDRMGLVIFSSEAFLQCPLTSDHTTLAAFFGRVENGMIADGTAIGDGLGLSVYHLRKSKAVSKVVILLTDGINNTGSMDPLTAAEIAKKFGIRVYTIGVGSKGMAPYPFQTPFGIQFKNVPVEIDEALLEQVAEMTGGKYFRATDNNKLRNIYAEIDKLEKSKIDVTRYNKSRDEYILIAWIVFGIILSELLMKYLVLKKLP